MDSNSNESVGFWMITPSNEFRSGGPIKQGLTSHVGPTTLNVSPKLLIFHFLPYSNHKKDNNYSYDNDKNWVYSVYLKKNIINRKLRVNFFI